jgi:tetratricopeptide (TPR) repeat protein
VRVEIKLQGKLGGTVVLLQEFAMGFFDWLTGSNRLFARLTPEEKREALDINFNESDLQTFYDARKGKVKLQYPAGREFLSKMTEDDIKQAIEILRLQKKALAAAEAGNHREAIRQFETIVKKAPFDSISMMSIGVQYAQLGDARKAVQCLRKALKSDPTNQRIRANLQAIRGHFGL